MRPVVFGGPTIYGLEAFARSNLDLRAPASSGDLFRAVGEGCRIIGLIDGLYGDCAAVWHKEILFALSRGVIVVGAASMGALRAAECATFGMIGVGAVFEAYRDGIRVSDADVAVTHAPSDLGFKPLTVALVDVEQTLKECPANVSVFEKTKLLDAARRLHFSKRTWRAIVSCAGLDNSYAAILRDGEVSVKRKDAMLLLEKLVSGDVRSPSESFTWTFQNTVFFEGLRSRAESFKKA